MTAIKAKNGKTISENVRQILKELPETRNNDRLLMAYYWAVVDEVVFDDFDEFLETFAKATPPSSIQRVRQTINYEAPDENLLPTEDKVLRRRIEMAQIMRDKHNRIKILGGV